MSLNPETLDPNPFRVLNLLAMFLSTKSALGLSVGSYMKASPYRLRRASKHLLVSNLSLTEFLIEALVANVPAACRCGAGGRRHHRGI